MLTTSLPQEMAQLTLLAVFGAVAGVALILLAVRWCRRARRGQEPQGLSEHMDAAIRNPMR